MTSVLHVIDGDCDETQLQVLETLRARLARDGQRHAICSIEGSTVALARSHLACDVARAERRLWRGLNWAPQLPQVARRQGARVVHAWGVEAAAACSARLPDLPLVMTLLNPDATRRAARWIRSFPTDATVVAASWVIRSRLISAGVATERVVVIRGPADFGAIREARQTGVRPSVVGAANPVLLMPGPPSRRGGQHFGIWAAGIVKQVHRGLRVILPYDSKESRRSRRFVQAIEMPSLLTVPDARLSWPELVTCADVFVVPAVDEVCIEPIAVAMAAGLVVVAAAVRSVTELIADGHNGLLCKPGVPRLLAARILQALDDADLRRRVTDVARGQAYEVFGVRSFVDRYARLYENVVAGRSPGDGIRDSVMVACDDGG